MHAVAEIVLPPDVTDIKKAIDDVMLYFSDHNEEDQPTGSCDWYDFYNIGGRYSGNKVIAAIDKDSLDRFYAALGERGVTVSGVQSGKQELSPASQIPMVDALWRELCPGHGDQCQLFAHSGNNNTITDGNVCAVGELPESLKCERLIVAQLSWDQDKHPGGYEAGDMLATSYWNKCRRQKTDFDGNVKNGIARLIEEQGIYLARAMNRDHWDGKEAFITRLQREAIGPDWLVVTVDYHH